MYTLIAISLPLITLTAILLGFGSNSVIDDQAKAARLSKAWREHRLRKGIFGYYEVK